MEVREQLFTDYWQMGNLKIQREFLSRQIEVSQTERKTKGAETRRKSTKKYFLQVNQEQRVQVCQTMFLNTFAISEKTTRTALEKIQPTGVLSQDKRGGRTEGNAQKDAEKKEAILNHLK